MQTETIDKHGTDCHCAKTVDIYLTEKSYSDLQYRYIMDNGNPVCLTPEIAPRYFNKHVKLRSPMYCKGDKICNICAGEMNYKLNALAVGLG